MELLAQLKTIGWSIGALFFVNTALMLLVPYSYVFFGIQSIILFSAFMFFMFGVVTNKDNLAYSRKLLASSMTYFALLEVPCWAGGLGFFCWKQKEHKLHVTWYIIASLFYICIPIACFGAFQAVVKKIHPEHPDSESESSEEEEVKEKPV